jgi:hypothetical protein
VLESLRHPLAIRVPDLLFLHGLGRAGVAQLVEHLICNQRVGGSIPSASSTRICVGSWAERILAVKIDGLVSLDTSPFCVSAELFELGIFCAFSGLRSQ